VLLGYCLIGCRKDRLFVSEAVVTKYDVEDRIRKVSGEAPVTRPDGKVPLHRGKSFRVIMASRV
jgi:hypothetical protein